MKFKIISGSIRIVFGFIAILIIDLLVNYLLKYLLGIKLENYIRTLLGMVSIMLLFYFFLGFIDKWTKIFLASLKNKSQRFAGQYVGLIIMTVILFYALFCGYYYLWNNGWPDHINRILALI